MSIVPCPVPCRYYILQLQAEGQKMCLLRPCNFCTLNPVQNTSSMFWFVYPRHETIYPLILITIPLGVQSATLPASIFAFGLFRTAAGRPSHGSLFPCRRCPPRRPVSNFRVGGEEKVAREIQMSSMHLHLPFLSLPFLHNVF